MLNLVVLANEISFQLILIPHELKLDSRQIDDLVSLLWTQRTLRTGQLYLLILGRPGRFSTVKSQK